MNVLVCATRQPFALDEIRKLGRTGHTVVAVDSFDAAPGSHSRHVHRRLTTAAPRLDPLRFIEDVARIVQEERIDLVLPTFEEVFYLARHRTELGSRGELFAPSFETLARLHHKGELNRLATSLGIAVPRTTVVTSRGQLYRALSEQPFYVARPVYSRGGTRLLTNVGALAGLVALDGCCPTEELPWVVQEWIEGDDLCTFSIARYGRVTAHVSYIHRMQLEHSSGIVIESVDAPETLEPAARLAEALGYHGQMSLDFRRRPGGQVVLLECNPRACNGVCLMSAEMFAEALVDDGSQGARIPRAGRRRMISLAVVRDVLRNPRHIRAALGHLFSKHARDVFADRDDPLPAVYQLLTYGQIRRYARWAGPRRDRRTDIIEAFSYDYAWDGHPIP